MLSEGCSDGSVEEYRDGSDDMDGFADILGCSDGCNEIDGFVDIEGELLVEGAKDVDGTNDMDGLSDILGWSDGCNEIDGFVDIEGELLFEGANDTDGEKLGAPDGELVGALVRSSPPWVRYMSILSINVVSK